MASYKEFVDAAEKQDSKELTSQQVRKMFAEHLRSPANIIVCLKLEVIL